MQLKVGHVLSARKKPTEFYDRHSKDGIRIEDFVDMYRPDNCPSRLECKYSVLNADDLNLAGAAEDFVYEVQPQGKTHVAHFGWIMKILGMSDKALRNNKTAISHAKAYWSGKQCPQRAAWEMLSDKIKILEFLPELSTSTPVNEAFTPRAAMARRYPSMQTYDDIPDDEKTVGHKSGNIKEISEQDREEAAKKLNTIEKKYGSTFKAKLKAFDWADDPVAALADLMRKAGKDPKKESDMKLTEQRLRSYIQTVIKEQANDTVIPAEEVIDAITKALPAAKIRFDPRYNEISVSRIGSAEWGFRVNISSNGIRVVCPKFAVDGINKLILDLGFKPTSSQKLPGASYFEVGDYEVKYSAA